MRERKHVKFRVDMYDDTKFKIIDTNPERDLIHYIWTRFVTLAGKVNLEGELYMSKNTPYTIETLAIEFNRGTYQIKLALDVLIELEMIELTRDNIYRVKNFAKHQNIKVKERIKSNDKLEYMIKSNDNLEDIKKKEDQMKENFKNEKYDNKDKESENKISEIESENVIANEIGNLEITHKDINKIDINTSDKKINNNSQNSIPIILETKKNKKVNKRKKKVIEICSDDDDDDSEDNCLVRFYDGDGERPFAEGERIIHEWVF